MTWAEAAARWYAVLVAVTWGLAPAVWWLCRALPDRGATLTRPIAVLVAIYPAWLLSSIGPFPFTAWSVGAMALVVGALTWTFAFRRHGLDRAWLRALAFVELAAGLLFGAYIWLRGYTPQIVGTEKPMDIAFLASSGRAVSMPPLDPWFASEPINYYYLGYLLHGTIGRLAAIPPPFAFNLALATIFSATALAAFGAAWNVAVPRLGRGLAIGSGCFAAFMVVLSGNLYAPLRLLQDATGTVAAWWWDSAAGIGWRSSRIVCDGPRAGNLCPPPASETINEFPFFSFLLGDLHPHVMALPYTLVAVALAWNLSRRHLAGADRGWWTRVAFSGALAGSLYPLNAWDLPTYLLLLAVGIWLGFDANLGSVWRPIALLGASAVIPWLPFLLRYDPPSVNAASELPTLLARLPVVSSALSTIAAHHGERTSLGEYLTMFGAPYVFGIGLVLSGALLAPVDVRRDDLRTFVVASVVTLLPGVLLSAPVVPLCGIPLTLAIVQILRHRSANPRTFALILFAFAWLLSIGVELFYVRDAFDDRMNTLFKFYYQTWTLYAVAAAVTAAILWKAANGFPARKAVVATGIVAAVVAGLAYPIVASYQWTAQFSNWQGLDGLAYAEETSPDEVAAIRWLAQNAQPGDIILEAAGCSYLPSGRLPFDRVSAFTGVPTIIGWAGHERQWRAALPAQIADIGARQANVSAMYADPQSRLFDEYRINWLFVGDYERGDWRTECETAGPYEGLNSPDFPGADWQEAFRSGDTVIFRRLLE